MSGCEVQLERNEKVAILTLDRPERHNALNEAMWAAIDTALDELEARPPRAVVLTGAGTTAFCAGMDVNPDNPQIARLVDAIRNGDRDPAAAFLQGLRRTVDRLVGVPFPVIAAINGKAYGGGAEIATRCDLRVADPGAILCFSEVRLGLMPDMGGGPALTHLIGPGRAADLILTARKVTADEALSLGLVNRVSAPGCALDEALDLAQRIAKNGPRAVRSAVDVIRRSADLPITDALDLELRRAADLIASGEGAVGIRAFLSGTAPDFPDVE
jgi:enoyl-CoA hydratase/carnithine racemase